MLTHTRNCLGALPRRCCQSRPVAFSPVSHRRRVLPSSRVHSTQQQPHNSHFRRPLLSSLLLSGAVLLGATAMPPSRAIMASAQGSSIAKVLEDPKWPDELPYSPEDFQRFDESPDTFFYGQPRFVTHIDDKAIAAITRYYEEVFPPAGKQDVAILDMCSSWISHYPAGFSAGRIAGLGMNREELARNPVLTDYKVQDLNVDPSLPYEDNSFDIITNVVSVDYLTKPLEIFKEMHRVLKPGGQAIMSFSNRCFPTKAIAIWTSSSDADHVYIVGSYFHYSVPGGWTPPKGIDISPKAGLFGGSDPMYIVTANKVA